jgi:hypothetical protein
MFKSRNILRILQALLRPSQCVGALLLVLELPLRAASVTIAWDPGSDSNVVGFHVYYGVASRNYPYMLDAGDVTTATLSNLLDGVTYYVAATTYDATGLESDFSAELSFTVSLGTNSSSTNSSGSNSLPQVRGTYWGLFSEPDQVRQQSAGAFAISVSGRGAYSGYLQLGPSRLGFSGRLDSTGNVKNAFRRRGGSLALELALNAGDQPPTVSGQLTGGSWTAIVQGRQAVFDPKINPAPFAGNFILSIPGQSGSAALPAGAGFGIAHINRAGRVTLAATLADGTTFNRSAQISADGLWPLYAPLYTGNGLVWSWLSFTNQSLSNLQGQLTWLKPPTAGARFYPDGFALQTQAVGSSYQAPSNPSTASFDLNNSLLTFSDGSLTSDFTNSLATAPSVRLFAKGNGVRMVFSRSTGTFQGLVTVPGSGHTLLFRGAVLPQVGSGYGFLLDAGQSSLVTLTPSGQ